MTALDLIWLTGLLGLVSLVLGVWLTKPRRECQHERADAWTCLPAAGQRGANE